MRRRNRRRHTPIEGLAAHILYFTFEDTLNNEAYGVIPRNFMGLIRFIYPRP